MLILGTPDYHGAPSGILKNFMDHFWKEFAGKRFGIVVSSAGSRDPAESGFMGRMHLD